MLIALRKAFARTYFGEEPLKDAKAVMNEIRGAGVDALRPFQTILEALRLPAVPAAPDGPDRCRLFKFVIAPARTLRQRVKDEDSGRVSPLIELIPAEPADHVVRALRHILTLTFSEVYDRAQYDDLFAEIRRVSASVLAPLNWILEEIDVEPVAKPREVDGGLPSRHQARTEPGETK